MKCPYCKEGEVKVHGEVTYDTNEHGWFFPVPRRPAFHAECEYCGSDVGTVVLEEKGFGRVVLSDVEELLE